MVFTRENQCWKSSRPGYYAVWICIPTAKFRRSLLRPSQEIPFCATVIMEANSLWNFHQHRCQNLKTRNALRVQRSNTILGDFFAD